MSNPPEKLYSIRDISKLISVGERTLRRWLSCGGFPKPDVRLRGKLLRWRRSTVDAWVQSQSVTR